LVKKKANVNSKVKGKVKVTQW